MRIRELGYSFEVPLNNERSIDDIRTWLRQVGILGEPTDEFDVYPDGVWLTISSDPAAGNGGGAEILVISFKRHEDAMLFKLTFGGTA